MRALDYRHRSCQSETMQLFSWLAGKWRQEKSPKQSHGALLMVCRRIRHTHTHTHTHTLFIFTSNDSMEMDYNSQFHHRFLFLFLNTFDIYIYADNIADISASS